MYEGNELDATYILSSKLLYTLLTSDVITLLPNSISTVELDAVFIFLLKSYSLLLATSGITDIPAALNSGSILIVWVDVLTLLTTPVPATFSSFLNNISTWSPTLMLDLSISLVSKTKLLPLILLTWNLEEVL